MKLEIALAAHTPAMAALHAAAFDPPWTAADIAELLGSVGGFGLLVRADSQAPAGFVLARAIAGEAEILTLAVDPAARRGGLGLALLAAAAALAQENGAGAIFLEVADDNVAAIALYAKAGFAEVGRRRGYYLRPDGATADARVLRLDLNSRRP